MGVSGSGSYGGTSGHIVRGLKHWMVFAAIGLIGGVLSGMFAIGGGIVMVPLLVAFAGLTQRLAAATTLAAIIPAALFGSITYLSAGEIDLLAGIFISAGAVPGAVIGSALLKRIPLAWLRWMFIAFILIVAARMFFITPIRGEPLEFSIGIAVSYVALGLAVGVLSGLFGIGGGIIVVPALIGVFAVSDLIAKGTSLLVMIPTSIVGTFSNWRAGAVEVRVGLIVGVAATIGSIPGALLALLIPPRWSSVLFGMLLVAVAAQLAFRAIRIARETA